MKRYNGTQEAKERTVRVDPNLPTALTVLKYG